MKRLIRAVTVASLSVSLALTFGGSTAGQVAPEYALSLQRMRDGLETRKKIAECERSLVLTVATELGFALGSNVKGAAGEKIVSEALDVAHNRTRFRGTGLSRVRVPDFIKNMTIFEVKNVKVLDRTRQLDDYLRIASKRPGWRLTIVTRAGTRITPRMARWIAESGGRVSVVKCLPGRRT